MVLEKLVKELSNIGIDNFTILGNKLIINSSLITNKDIGKLHRDLIIKGNLSIPSLKKDLSLNLLKVEDLEIHSSTHKRELSVKELYVNTFVFSKLMVSNTRAKGDILNCNFGGYFVNCNFKFNVVDILLDRSNEFENIVIEDSAIVRLFNAFSKNNKGSLKVRNSSRVMLLDEPSINLEFDKIKYFIIRPNGTSNLNFTGDVDTIILIDSLKEDLENSGVFRNLKYKRIIETSESTFNLSRENYPIELLEA